MRVSRFAALVALAASFGTPSGARADVNVAINVGPPPPPPPIVLAEPPRLVLVPQMPVYYSPSLSYNFFYHGERYYTFHENAWYWATSVHGPWGHIEIGSVPRPVLAVPIAYYKVRPVKWKKYKRGGPPPWAPAHGYRRKHGHGHHHD